MSISAYNKDCYICFEAITYPQGISEGSFKKEEITINDTRITDSPSEGLTPIITKCNHAFHERCLKGWINEYKSKTTATPCPSCRTELVKPAVTSQVYSTPSQVNSTPSQMYSIIQAQSPFVETAQDDDSITRYLQHMHRVRNLVRSQRVEIVPSPQSENRSSVGLEEDVPREVQAQIQTPIHTEQQPEIPVTVETAQAVSSLINSFRGTTGFVLTTGTPWSVYIFPRPNYGSDM